VIPGLSDGERCVTITYFKPVLGGVLERVAQIVNRGKWVASIESSVLADGVLIARASGNDAIVRPRSRRAE